MRHRESKYLGVFALWLVLLMPFHGQAQFTDDFSDNDFTANPTWSGDDSIFVASTGILRLMAAPISSEAAMSTPSQAIENASWEFFVNLDFNPSSSNLARVYLVSDQASLRGALNGYFVEIGGTTDEVSLYRQDGSSDSELIDGFDDVTDNDPVLLKVRVTRDNLGNWELLADTTTGFTNYVSQGTAFDDTYTQSFYTGVYCDYTSTRSDKFYFDDFVVTGTAFTDTVTPTISSITVLSDLTLDLYFSEPVDQPTAEAEGNYSANNGIGTPASAILDGVDNTLVHLTFGNAFGNGVTNNLAVTNVQDLAANPVNDNENFIYFVADSAIYRDVVINELMPDPTPANDLPEAEYVELLNVSNKIFDLNGWTLSDGSSTATLGPWVLTPGSRVILVANADTAVFLNNVTSNTLGVSSFPSLNNSGDNVTLRNDSGGLVDAVNYDISWYQDDNKDGGGWSLELINPELPCSNPFNWIASNHVSGGTPGAQNSVYDNTADTQGPQLLTILVDDADTIELVFDEALDSLSVLNATYAITNGVVASSIINMPPTYDRVRLVLSPSLTAGVIHDLTITGITDCSGNNISFGTGQFALPQAPEAGDIIINEVLFNPVTGGDDFVEIYNNSDKILSLKDWSLANHDDDTIDNFKVITEEAFLLYPEEYLVLTTDPQNIWSEYPGAVQNRFLQMASLPTYSNDSATVILVNNLDVVSDRFSYDEDMHFGLLNDPDGVSLERIDFDRPTNDATNWHSAAENVGFATPGYENSQYYPTTIADDAITLDPPVFSPDNDGYQDVLNINYQLDGPGYVGSITIYDPKGREIRQLVRSELLATAGTFSWDGIQENREKARVGIYVLVIEIFNLEGDVTVFKRTAVLGSRL